MWAAFADDNTEFAAEATVLSPLISSACAPLAATDVAASNTPAELSTVVSRSSIPSSPQIRRASRVKISEFDSAGFQTRPIASRFG